MVTIGTPLRYIDARMAMIIFGLGAVVVLVYILGALSSGFWVSNRLLLIALIVTDGVLSALAIGFYRYLHLHGEWKD